jgi:hypothetical protein
MVLLDTQFEGEETSEFSIAHHAKNRSKYTYKNSQKEDWGNPYLLSSGVIKYQRRKKALCERRRGKMACKNDQNFDKAYGPVRRLRIMSVRLEQRRQDTPSIICMARQETSKMFLASQE